MTKIINVVVALAFSTVAVFADNDHNIVAVPANLGSSYVSPGAAPVFSPDIGGSYGGPVSHPIQSGPVVDSYGAPIGNAISSAATATGQTGQAGNLYYYYPVNQAPSAAPNYGSPAPSYGPAAPSYFPEDNLIGGQSFGLFDNLAVFAPLIFLVIVGGVLLVLTGSSLFSADNGRSIGSTIKDYVTNWDTFQDDFALLTSKVMEAVEKNQ